MNMESCVSGRALSHPGLSLGKVLLARDLICALDLCSGKVNMYPLQRYKDHSAIVHAISMAAELVNGSLFLIWPY